MSDFLFLDMAVKAMKPGRSWTRATAAIVKATPPSVSGAAIPTGPGAGINGVDWYTYKLNQGTGPVDLWNPQYRGTPILFP